MKGGFREVDANAHAAEVRFFTDSGWQPASVEMPFDRLLAEADDGEDGEAGEYELRQRMLGVRMFFQYLAAKGIHPAMMLRQLACIGRALHIEPWATMDMRTAAELMSETPAAHSYRCKLLSKEIEAAGMSGTRLPGQKTDAATATYREIRKGNGNRKGGAKAAALAARKARLAAGNLSNKPHETQIRHTPTATHDHPPGRNHALEPQPAQTL